MKIYFLYVRGKYMRNAQAYLYGSIDADIHDESAYDDWQDIFGDLLLMEFNEDSTKVVRKKIRELYPCADMRIFKLVMVSAKKIKEVRV
ncbi:MAG: hypothetical protein Q4G33_06470 [bacterium]|nr:hypothetical protein [bacterium]